MGGGVEGDTGSEDSGITKHASSLQLCRAARCRSAQVRTVRLAVAGDDGVPEDLLQTKGL
jgi:hypothetical protein